MTAEQHPQISLTASELGTLFTAMVNSFQNKAALLMASNTDRLYLDVDEGIGPFRRYLEEMVAEYLTIKAYPEEMVEELSVEYVNRFLRCAPLQITSYVKLVVMDGRAFMSRSHTAGGN